jgi:hypothetical protein
MPRTSKYWVVCLRNEGYEVSLEKRKLYIALPGDPGERHGLLRVIDESGEDYLYPRKFFAEVELPPSLRRAVLTAA